MTISGDTSGVSEEMRTEIQAEAQALHDKINAINPNLVVRVAFGDRRLAPIVDGNADLSRRAETEKDSFRNSWASGGHFGDGFLKDGDGFTNVSWLEARE